jgi:succinoglycan biosynthesis protein ExoA
MGETIDCSVLIPVYNEERYIEQTVTAMRAQREAGTVEFVFADGGSTDRTREILDRLAGEDPRIVVVDNPGRSVSSGLNVALRVARGRWIVRMDAHTVYPSDYIARGVQRLEQGDTRWVSGPPVPRGHNPVSRAVALALSTPFGRGGSRKWARDGEHEAPEVELDSGVFGGVWQRSTLLEYGGWDERWPRNSDSEMAARFLARDERLVCVPRMAAEYTPRDSIGGLWRQYVGYGDYRVRTSRRHPHSLRRSHLLPAVVAGNAAVAIAGPRRLRRLAQAGAAAHAVALLALGVRALPQADPRSDALLVPVVLGAMHYGFGYGALAAMAGDGVPLAAIVRIAGLGGLADRLTSVPDTTFAPSLADTAA